MRIVHVITKADFGGAQTHVFHVVSEQRRRGHDVAVIAGLDGPVADALRGVGVDVTIEPDLRRVASPVRDLRAIGALRRHLRTLRPDVVHSHSSKGGLIGRIAARSLGVPSVYTAHGFPFQAGAPTVQRVTSWLFEAVGGRFGSSVVCLTEAEAALARRARVCRADRIRVIANGLPDDAPVRTRPPGTPIEAVMVARCAPPKLHRELIDEIASRPNDSWTIDFVGDGPDFESIRRYGERALPERARFLGHRDDVADLLAERDVAVLASRYEGMPISLLESMRAANAIVASDLPGVRVLLGPFAPLGRTVSEIVDHLGQLDAEPERLGELGSRNRQRFLERFEIGRVVDQLDALYDDLTSSG